MLTVYPNAHSGEASLTARKAVWIDLLDPSDDERGLVENEYRFQLPTRQDLSEVELSSRVSEEDGVLFLNMPTVTFMNGMEQPPSPVGFVLSKDVLVTLRYTQLRSFDTVTKRFSKDGSHWSGVDTFLSIVDEMVDLNADLLEGIAAELETTSRAIFSKLTRQKQTQLLSNDELRELLVNVGNAGERLSRVRDSVLGLQRIVLYVAGTDLTWVPHAARAHLATPRNDLASLNEYQTNLSDKVQFLLDAVLGFINIKQSDIFQVLTVISVVGIPPTLVASIYGMNFKYMPELNWTWGYAYGLGMILLSAIIPIVWFKWRRWV